MTVMPGPQRTCRRSIVMLTRTGMPRAVAARAVATAAAIAWYRVHGATGQRAGWLADIYTEAVRIERAAVRHTERNTTDGRQDTTS